MANPPPAANSSPAAAAQPPLPWPEPCTQMLKLHGYTDPIRLGEGGYSVVYKFKSSKTGDRKEVAIKYIEMDKIRDPAYKLKYMPRELRALMLLKHPNICVILEGLNDGPIHANKFPHRYWIIMELCKTDLFEIAAQCPNYMIPEKYARIWIKQIASALEYMKDNTWAHRE
jgi:serine/threonine protein kinase